MDHNTVMLTIAGSDNTGGAGIQADIKTACAYGVYSASVITGVTSQNSRHVYGVEPVSGNMLRSQIDSIYEVMTPAAVKTGMLPTAESIAIVAEKLRQLGVKNLVVDPVMVATNGDTLGAWNSDMVELMKHTLLPLATLVTPNLSEARILSGLDPATASPTDVCKAIMDSSGCAAVLLKGGHSLCDESVDFLYDGESITEFSSPRFDTLNTHGTGCTLSSALACGLAQGDSLSEAVGRGKQFVSAAISGAMKLKITDGPGPLDFFAMRQDN